jgi:hypothetical protein
MQEAIIEQYLKALDQATFQKLMDKLLIYEGHKFLGSPGTVVGKNKTRKGTPDSFFADNDRFIFCEYTTQERLKRNESFFSKLKKDIDHCFDSSKTKIDNQKISTIILGATWTILPNEMIELKDRVRKYNPRTELLTYTIQQLPHKLLFFPGLADKYIPGLKTTKGSILTLKDFLGSSERGLQPSLTNPFVGRETDIEKAKVLLTQFDVLILKGYQGVGKSRLAVHLAELYQAQGYHARVISNGPIPAWDDLQNFILPNEKYVIVFDDANKALHNLEYLVQFLQQREGFIPKVIITVRDYVRNTLDHVLMNYRFAEFSIEKFDGKEIKEIVQKSIAPKWTIFPHALERIENISKGNCRIALMATAAILKDPNASLNTAEELYDAYFKQLSADVSILKSRQQLLALAVLSFFNVLDQSDQKLQTILETEFGINWNTLWVTFIELEQAELVEMHSQAIVKISDQILATYVSYKAFFDPTTSVLPYSFWLNAFLGKYDTRIRNSITDLINTYGYSEMQDKVTGHLVETQQALGNDHNRLYQFFEIFWFYRDIETLSFVKTWIDSLAIEDFVPDWKRSITVPKDYSYSTKFVDLLSPFWYQKTPLTRSAIEMGVDLTTKQPSRLNDMIKVFHDNLTYHRYDFQINYERQKILLEVLDDCCKTPNEKYIGDQVFLSIAKDYLEWDCTQVEGNSGGSMSIFTFSPFVNESLIEFRKSVLIKLISLFSEYENHVLTTLESYVWAGREFNADVFQSEQQIIVSFIKQNLLKTNFRHCNLVKRYQKTLADYDLAPAFDYDQFSNSEVMSVATIFTYQMGDFDIAQRSEKTKNKMGSIIESLDLKGLAHVFEIIQNIDSTFEGENALQEFMIVLATDSPGLFDKALEHVMLGDFKIANNEGWFISQVVAKQLVDLESFYKKITSLNYKQRQIWKQSFFHSVSSNQINKFFLCEFIDFLTNITDSYYAGSFHEYAKYTEEFLKRFPEIDHPNFVTYAAEILLKKASNIRVFFDRRVCERCLHLFTQRPSLLKSIYMHQSRSNIGGHYDYTGTELKSVCSLDKQFVFEYLMSIAAESRPLRFSLDKINLRFIWEFEDYEMLIDEVLEIVIKASPPWSNFEHTANALFKQDSEGVKHKEIMLSYIARYIDKFNHQKNHMIVIMNVVCKSFRDMRMDFFKRMVQLNLDLEIYRQMHFETGGISGSSLVPTLERQISFTKVQVDVLKSLPNPLKYAPLVTFFENRIVSLLEHKQRELKQDFVGWKG